MMRLENLGYTGGVLVIRAGRPVLTRSYGLANRAAGIVADTATVYNLGSITKQFTAAAILRLEEQGKLHTTDSIARFFPDAPTDKRGITLHLLLTHIAGFNSDYSPIDYETTTRDEYVRRMFAAPLRSAPGTAHFYSNAGCSLLAAIVELATGTDYERALHDLVLQPAGMTESGYKGPGWAPARIAHGYQNGRDWGTIVDRIAPADAPYWALRGNGSRLVLRADHGRLMADAVGQQADALLTTGDTASPPGAMEANERARAIVEALVVGNVGPLLAALGEGGADSAEVARQEAQLMDGRRQRLGAYRSLDVIGTLRAPDGGLRTTVRLNFERGGATNIYTFNRSRRIEDLGARPYSAVELIPSGAHEFRSFDPRGGGSMRLVFEDMAAFAITPAGRVTLARP